MNDRIKLLLKGLFLLLEGAELAFVIIMPVYLFGWERGVFWASIATSLLEIAHNTRKAIE